MIRFIDLGDQILEGQRQLAWFNTISDTFEHYNGSEAWDDWKEFEEDYNADPRPIDSMYHIERYKALFPKEWPPPFVSPEDRKKRYEKGICDDVVDGCVIPDPKKLMKCKKKLDKLLKKP